MLGTVVGILAALLLLLPGFAYAVRKSRTHPVSEASSLSEVLALLLVGTISLVLAIWLTAIAASFDILPEVDVERLIRDAREYAAEDYRTLAASFITVVSAATVIAWIMADPRLARLTHEISNLPVLRLVTGSTGTDIRPQGSWFVLMHVFDDDPGRIYIGAELMNGSYIEGTLFSYSTTAHEGPDRDLVLVSPIALRDSQNRRYQLEVQYSVLSARDIVRLDVSFLATGSRGEVRRTASAPEESRSVQRSKEAHGGKEGA